MGFIFTGIFWGVFFLILGVIIILKTFFDIDIPIFRVLIAIFFIWIGIRILVGGPIFKSNKSGVVFGDARIDANDIKESKDDYSIVFGRGTIDLTKIDLGNISKEININTIFAYSMIKINSKLPAIIILDSAFARVKLPDKGITSFGSYTYKTKTFDDEKPYLKIKIDVVFGSADIVEY